MRPVLTLPSSDASSTKTAFAFCESSLIKLRDAWLPVSSSVVATSATDPSIPLSAKRACKKPTFISKVPGPRITSPLISNSGWYEPFGQTVSKCASKTISGLASPHQKTGRPSISRICAGVPKTSAAIALATSTTSRQAARSSVGDSQRTKVSRALSIRSGIGLSLPYSGLWASVIAVRPP